MCLKCIIPHYCSKIYKNMAIVFINLMDITSTSYELRGREER